VQDQDLTTALPGLAGCAAAPASSALIMRARAFRAWLVGAPDSLAAQGTSEYRLPRRGKPAGGQARLADAGQAGCCRRGVVVLLRGLSGPKKDRARPVIAAPGVRLGPGPVLPGPRRTRQGTEASPVLGIGCPAALRLTRSMCASAVPGPGAAGRQAGRTRR